MFCERMLAYFAATSFWIAVRRSLFLTVVRLCPRRVGERHDVAGAQVRLPVPHRAGRRCGLVLLFVCPAALLASPLCGDVTLFDLVAASGASV